MKFAAPFQDANCPIPYDEIDQFNILFTEMSHYEELEAFIKLYPNHRINVLFDNVNSEDDNIDGIIDICNKYENIYVRLRPQDLIHLSDYHKNNVRYFFDRTMPIYTYGLLEWALECSPTDIYIADDLTYNLEEVYKQCQAKNIELRVILNRVPKVNFLKFVFGTSRSLDFKLLEV